MADSTAGVKQDRRVFLGAVLGVSGVALIGQSGLILKDYMVPIVEEGAFGSVVNVGRVEDFDVPSVNYFREARFYLVRIDEGFLALYRKCTHLGCVIPWEEAENQFNCPCHSSLFTPVGEVISGPAPRPMDLFPVEIREGEVWVDTGNVIERAEFSPDQVTPA